MNLARIRQLRQPPLSMDRQPRVPFAVLRWLSIAVVVIIVCVTILLGIAIVGRTQRYLVRQNEDYAENLAFHLNDVLYAQFAQAITTSPGAPLPDTSELDRTVRHILIGLNICRLTIYDQTGRVIYTTQPDQIPPVDQAAVRAALDHALTGQAQSTFVHKPVSDGTLATILATYVPIHPAGGAAASPKVLGAFAIEQDLSAILAQLQREQFLIAALVGALMLVLLFALLLAIRWAGGIMRAQHTELLNRHAALVELQQVRDDLTRLIVHDLRNPLTAIGGYLDILAMSDADVERRSLIAIARSSTRRMQDLIGTILDLQRLEEGQVPLQRQPTDVAALLQSSAEEFTGWAQRDGKRIQLTAAPDLPPVDADPDLLRRVVANLLSNALKHTPEGTIITLAAQDDPLRHMLVLTISDSGLGIPAEVLPRLFTRYARGAGAKEGGSSGLGLAFCRLAVEAHGGTIAVDSVPERGTTFTIELPLPQLGGAVAFGAPEAAYVQTADVLSGG
jgi:signal transduction histidine kinase